METRSAEQEGWALVIEFQHKKIENMLQCFKQMQHLGFCAGSDALLTSAIHFRSCYK